MQSLGFTAKGKAALGVLAVLTIIGVACKRVWLLFTSFIHPNVYGGPGITASTHAVQGDPTAMWTTLGAYAPTLPEAVIFIGIA